MLPFSCHENKIPIIINTIFYIKKNWTSKARYLSGKGICHQA